VTGHAIEPANWICCQLGAREHYSVPRALARAGRLEALVTDAWVDPSSSIASLMPQRLRERYHPELDAARVLHATGAAVSFETRQALAGARDWQLVIRRNHWFQRRALHALTALARRVQRRPITVFAYSYAARQLLEFARSQGWRTVLGQIDPGPAEERIVCGLAERHRELAGGWKPAPVQYWTDWRDECALADRIIVNSQWSKDALVSEQIDPGKVQVVPLAFEPPAATLGFHRRYPTAFDDARPLRVLFLGQVILRKGLAAIIDAMRLVKDLPIEFHIVGPVNAGLPEDVKTSRRVQWYGSVPRGDVERHYRDADLLLFPTLSDGFGLTQLEAQAWKLPIVTSPYCAAVVSDGVNGMVLSEVSGGSVARALRSLVASPDTLRRMSGASMEPASFGLSRLAADVEELCPR
jgi:glycosyltransferase involved in cell wall biosynthesis